MALLLYRSNRLEHLATVLCDLVHHHPPDDPFQPLRVVVGSRGVARWLRHRLAEQIGVCANVAFPFPAATLDSLLAAASGARAPCGADPWQPDALAWRVLDALPAFADHPDFAWLAPYLSDDGVVLPRQWGVARQIADVFDRYVTYRPKLAIAWSEGRAADAPLDDDLAWQPVLWRALAAQIDRPHRAQRADAAIRRLHEGPPPPTWRSLRIFGVSSLPPGWLDVLGAVARHADVHLHLLCPSSEYWADLRKRLRDPGVSWRDAAPDDIDARLADAAARGNPLLASLGRQARDFQLILESQPEGYEDVRLDLFADPAAGGTPSALQQLQADILHARAPAGGAPLAPDDRSIQLHAAPGPTRQVEVLRELLLRMFDEDRTLHPRDVLIMTPDIQTYAPLVSAVFADGRRSRDADGWGPAGAPQIPHEIADLSVRRLNPVADALLRVLALVSGRVRASEVLDLLQLGPVRARFGVDEAGIERIATWVADAGIRWGLDGSHRVAYGLPDDPQNTWQFGLERLLFGVAMRDDEQLAYGAVRPFDAVEGNDTLILGRFVHFARTLNAELAALAAPRPAAAWATRLLQTVERLTLTDGDDTWLTLGVTRELERLRDESQRDGAARSVAVGVALRALTERFDRASPHGREQSGAVSVCAMAPMRSVPYRVVCLLGLDDGALPRLAQPDAFDLTLRHPRPGDRDLRDEDRYLFLEALLAARERLLLLWTGRDVRSGEDRPPATPLAELIDTIDLTFAHEGDVAPSARLRRDHTLAPHSRDNFTGGGALHSHDRRALAGAVAASGPRHAPRPFHTGAHPPPDQELDSLDLDELIRFLERPTEHLLRRRLQVDLRDEPDGVEDREPIELDNLTLWQRWDELVRARLRGVPTDGLPALLAAQGVLPLGHAGVAAAQQIATQLDEALAMAGLIDDGRVRPPSPPLAIDLQLRGLRLTGSLTRRWGDHLVQLHYRNESSRRWIRPWVELLAWHATEPGPWRALYVIRERNTPKLLGIDTPPGGPEAARDRLEQLVRLYRDSLAGPVPLFPDTSLRALKALDGQDDPDSPEARAAVAAKLPWGGRFHAEGNDPYVQRLYGDTPPFLGADGGLDPRFLAASRALWQDFLSLRRTNQQTKKWRG